MGNCVTSFYIDYKFEFDRMIKSLTHFHPEVTLEVYGKKEIEGFRELGQYTSFAYPEIELPLFKNYSTVTHIDADVIIVDRIDELFDSATDARAGRNNSDNGKAGTNLYFTTDGIHQSKYVNAGIHSVSSVKFMEDWYKLCRERNFPLGEQDALNNIFHLRGYNTRVLDPIDSNVHYGSSTIEGTKTHWDIWRNIVVGGHHLELNGKRIKMLHFAGGGIKPPIESLVSSEVNEFIKEIVG